MPAVAIALLVAVVAYLLLVPVIGVSAVVGLILAIAVFAIGAYAAGYRARRRP